MQRSNGDQRGCDSTIGVAAFALVLSRGNRPAHVQRRGRTRPPVRLRWAFADDWSARLEYDYYDFGTHTATMNDVVNGPGPLSFRTTMQMVKLGVNFHVWGWQ